MGKKVKKPFEFKDFEAVLALPERLAEYLRMLFRVDKVTWNFALDKMRQGKAYREWSKSKGPGKGRRQFAAPCDELKLVQEGIKCNVFDSIPIHFTRYGCQAGSGIVEHAAVHRGAVGVFSVDIMNAYPTVLRSRMRRVLQKPFRFLLDQFGGVDFAERDVKAMLESLIDLVCLHDRLPQGPPTSPRLLGIVCYKFDGALFRLLRGNSSALQSYKMTSWFDDTSVSSSGEISDEVREKVLAIIKQYGFIPHTRKDKTKYYSPAVGTVPVVTGVVIVPDGSLTMTPNKVNQLRAALHNWGKLAKWDAETLGKINGTLGAIRQVYTKKFPSKLRKPVEEINARLRLLKIEALKEKPKRARPDSAIKSKRARKKTK